MLRETNSNRLYYIVDISRKHKERERDVMGSEVPQLESDHCDYIACVVITRKKHFKYRGGKKIHLKPSVGIIIIKWPIMSNKIDTVSLSLSITHSFITHIIRTPCGTNVQIKCKNQLIMSMK